MKKKIFVVEDDAALRELYTYTLENEFDCTCFGCGDSFFGALKEKPKSPPDLILLDVMLPGDDGFIILLRLKSDKYTAHIPVIMVSAKGEELSKVKGLNIGADDYISKPFGVLELVARVKANLRKHAKSSDEIIFRDIVFDLQKHEIIANGNLVQATRKEFQLLRLLCENAEKVHTREAIFSAVWGVDFIGETRTLDIHIKELRKKLADAGSMAEIKTIRGVGYILT